MGHYLSYRSVLTQRFGSPVLKVPLNGGFSCPNRDGTKSSTGCCFCDNRSFSPVAESCNHPREQLAAVVVRMSHRFKHFIPYLQPFSNTYGTVENLKAIYEPLLTVPGVVGLALGTRPDCFSDPIYSYLEDVSRRTFLSVEIGLQSTHDRTLQLCNRGHFYQDFVEAVHRLADAGIETVAHMMLGLPGETMAMQRESANRIAALPLSGVKIHQVMIIEGTEFATWYQQGTLVPLSLEQYAEQVTDFIAHLRPDQHIHRIMADSKRAWGLIAPLWSEQKTAALQFITQQMDKYALVQGSASTVQ